LAAVFPIFGMSFEEDQLVAVVDSIRGWGEDLDTRCLGGGENQQDRCCVDCVLGATRRDCLSTMATSFLMLRFLDQ
jgi:hypothetical protein